MSGYFTQKPCRQQGGLAKKMESSGENVDEDHESSPEQSKRTLSSAKSPSGLVRSNGAKTRPKTTELLHNVRRKSCSKKDSVGAQNTQSVTAATPSSGKQNRNCSTPKNAQIGNEPDAVLGASESPEQLGYRSENNIPCERVRFKNEGSCGPKIESAFPRTSPHGKVIHFFQLFLALLLQIIQWSNQYASEGKVAKSCMKDGRIEEITLEEFKRLLACLLYMGIIKALDVKNYWAKCFHFRRLWACKFFPNRDRFRAILAALQVQLQGCQLAGPIVQDSSIL